jgi:hypothetical protein
MSAHVYTGRSAAAVIVVLVACASVSAHVTKEIGGLRFTIGWGDEPAFSGFRNAVEVDVADAAGKPVVDLGGGTLSADVSFGDERVLLSLLPVRREPGKFRAWLVPTRPGTYAFHVTGIVNGQTVDLTATCSDTTFACVGDVAEIQFPVKDPSAGQLADRITRSLPRAESAIAVATFARTLATIGLAGAVIAIGAAVLIGARKRSAGR